MMRILVVAWNCYSVDVMVFCQTEGLNEGRCFNEKEIEKEATFPTSNTLVALLLQFVFLLMPSLQ